MARHVNRRSSRAAVLVALALAMAGPGPVARAATEPGTSSSSPSGGIDPAPAPPAAATASPGRRAGHRQGRPDGGARWEALVKGLKLDAAQQVEVRRALQAQREAIRRLLRAPGDPETSRTGAILAITHRTTDRIRAVLSDEQKRLYGQALPGDVPVEGKPGVEAWMSALREKGR